MFCHKTDHFKCEFKFYKKEKENNTGNIFLILHVDVK
jgi:hypothetical protein